MWVIFCTGAHHARGSWVTNMLRRCGSARRRDAFRGYISCRPTLQVPCLTVLWRGLVGIQRCLHDRPGGAMARSSPQCTEWSLPVASIATPQPCSLSPTTTPWWSPCHPAVQQRTQPGAPLSCLSLCIRPCSLLMIHFSVLCPPNAAVWESEYVDMPQTASEP